MSFESVRRWLNGLRNPTTRKNYVLSFYPYCVEVGMTPDQLLEEKEASLRNPSMRGFGEDRLILWHRKKEKTTPGSAILGFKAVKSFFRSNYLPLSATIPLYVPQREQVHIPTRQEIKTMCEIAPSLEVKTMILLLAESGQRIGTLADLCLTHVKEGLADEPFCFRIPQKRNEHGVIIRSKRVYGHWGFGCEDAREALKLLIKLSNITQDSEKIFPKEGSSYSQVISNLATEIGINEEQGHGLRRFRPHVFRKRAQTLLEKAGVALNWVDKIMAHKARGSQADVYSLPTQEDLAAEYKKAMSHLAIYGEEKPQKGESEVDELKRRIAKLEAMIGKLCN